MRRFLLCSAVLACVAGSVRGSAQTTTPAQATPPQTTPPQTTPPAPTPRPPARQQPQTGSGRGTKSLSLSFDVARGRDDNSVPDAAPGGDPIGPFGPLDSGTITSVNAGANFAATKGRKSVEASALAFTSQSSAIDDNLTTLAANLQAGTSLGRRLNASVGGNVLSQPTVFFNPMAVSADGAALSPGPMQGLTSQRMISGGPTASMTYQWSLRHSTSANGSLFRQKPQTGSGLESQAYGFSLNHAWRTSRRLTTNVTYDFNDTTQDVSTTLDQVVRTHTGRLVLRYERALSARRNVGIEVGGGITRGDTSGFDGVSEFTEPSGRVTGHIDLGRSWSANAGIGRTVVVLPGITTDPFLSTATDLGLSGNPLRRVQVLLSASRADGSSKLLQSNSFETTTASGRIEVNVFRALSLFGSYAIYEHKLVGSGIVAAGVPGRYRRDSVRFGLSTSWQVWGARRRR